MKKNFFTLTALILVMAVSLCACGTGKKSGEELTKVTLNEVAHSIFYAPQYVAIQEGYFAQEGIELTLVNGFGAL